MKIILKVMYHFGGSEEAKISGFPSPAILLRDPPFVDQGRCQPRRADVRVWAGGWGWGLVIPRLSIVP